MRSRPQLPIVPLLLAIAMLAPAADEAPAPAAAPPAPDPKPAISPEQAQVLAEAAYTEGLAKYRAGAFAEALELAEQAVRLYPPHAGAQQLRSDVLAVLSNRDNRLKMAASWFGSLQDIRTQETAVRLSAIMDRADKAMAAGDYEAAELDYDRVEIGIRSFPFRFDWGELPAKVQARMAEARSKARTREIQQSADDRKAAAELARRQADLQAEALRLKVDELVRRAQTAFDRRDFRRAEIESWNAYELDRRREDARELYLAARREGHYKFDVDYRDEKTEGLARVAEEVHKSLIPQNELLIFPEDWQTRSMRKPREIGSQKTEAWIQALNDRLNQQRLTFDFQDQSFEDVIAFLRQVTGVNIIVAPAVLAAQGGGGTVTLRVKEMRFQDALDWILKITNLHYAVQDQALVINTEPISGAASLRLYDVTDLITPVRNFPGVELAYTSTDAKGGGGLLGGGNTTEDERTGPTPDEMVEFIKKNVTPDQWAPEKNIDVQQRSGSTLFVSHNAEGHKLVDQLLTNMRNQAALQVNVGVRLLDVSKNFFEEIGVEWHNSPTALINDPGSASTNAQTSYGYVRQNGSGTANTGYVTAGSVYQNLPANQAGYAITPATNSGDPTPKGLVLEGALNTSNFLNADQVNAIFSAAEDETDATLLNHPQITCFNGQRANASFIHQYAYISDYQIVSSNPDPVISVVSYGDLLDVRPVISSDHKYVTMEIRPTSVSLGTPYVEYLTYIIVSSNSGNGGVYTPGVQFPLELPHVDVQTLRSTVMIPDRGSLLIGGFNRSLRQRTQSGVPFLSHVPFAGRLFSRNGTYDQTRRVFYLLSANIMDLKEQESLQ